MKKKMIIRGLVLLAAAAVVLCAAVLFPRERAYREAVRLQENGDDAGAYRAFCDLGAWHGSADKAAALASKDPSLPLREAGKWSCVSFGRYEQDADSGNGPEPLEWFVLDREEKGEDGSVELLLLSRDCLACTAYHTPVENINWEKSTLREYLNGPFIQEAFNAGEQALLRTSLLENTGNDHLSAAGGQDTQDRVFLISAPEYAIYFRDEEAQWLYGRAQATPQAQRQGIFLSGQDGEEEREEEKGFTRWWLRSPGNEPYSAQFVEEDGQVFAGGAAVDIDYMYGLRPAVWVRLEREHPE